MTDGKIIHPRADISLFEPEYRSAILVNGKDLDVARQIRDAEEAGFNIGGDKYFRLHPSMYRGNRHIYAMEAILTGKIELEPKEGCELSERNKQILLDSFEDMYQYELKTARRKRPHLYNNVLKVFPDDGMQSLFDNHIKNIASYAHDKHFTLVYIFSHGSPDGFEMDEDNYMTHQSLIQKLDQIKGKKAIILAGCHSGNLANHVADTKDYAVLTSTDSGLDMNWNDDTFLELLVQMLAQNLSISKIINSDLFAIIDGGTRLTFPTAVMGFDVII